MRYATEAIVEFTHRKAFTKFYIVLYWQDSDLRCSIRVEILEDVSDGR